MSDDPEEPAEESLVGGYDLDGETATDVAPIAATVPTQQPDSTPTPRSGRDVPPPPASVEELEQQIRELEARLDKMIEKKEPAQPPAPQAPVAPAPDDAAARELAETDSYHRRRLDLRSRADVVDDFGFDPAYEARLVPLLDFLYGTWFRVDAEGAEHVPAEGRCLVVANHSGGPLPYDGLMLRTTLRREHRSRRDLRWLAEDFVHYLPFVGTTMTRLGGVRACQENAERLLASERAVAVFPEGAKGIGKLYKERYKLQRFGRGGFVRLALRTGSPIIPCAIVGAEEASPILHRVEYMTKALGIPYLPITPTFPALGPLGLVPAPVKWKIRFGPPIGLDGHGPGAADDDLLVGRLAERVRGVIQSMLDRTVAARRSIWFG